MDVLEYGRWEDLSSLKQEQLRLVGAQGLGLWGMLQRLRLEALHQFSYFVHSLVLIDIIFNVWVIEHGLRCSSNVFLNADCTIVRIHYPG